MNLMMHWVSRQAAYQAGLRMTSKVAASFFRQLGVTFCSRGIVSAANWSLSRLDEIKPVLLYALRPGRAADPGNPSCTQRSSFWSWRTEPVCCYKTSVSPCAERWCHSLSCPRAFCPIPSPWLMLLNILMTTPFSVCSPKAHPVAQAFAECQDFVGLILFRQNQNSGACACRKMIFHLDNSSYLDHLTRTAEEPVL